MKWCLVNVETERRLAKLKALEKRWDTKTQQKKIINCTTETERYKRRVRVVCLYCLQKKNILCTKCKDLGRLAHWLYDYADPNRRKEISTSTHHSGKWQNIYEWNDVKTKLTYATIRLTLPWIEYRKKKILNVRKRSYVYVKLLFVC